MFYKLKEILNLKIIWITVYYTIIPWVLCPVNLFTVDRPVLLLLFLFK